MVTNYTSAIFPSAFVTLALFYAMNALIGISTDVTTEPRVRAELDFVRVPPQEDPPKTIDPPFKKEQFEPPEPPANPNPGNTDDVIAVNFPTSGPPPVGKYEGPGILVHDGPPVSLVLPHPAYPASALRNGLEGWVMVRFDVLADGSIANIAVVESSDDVFEKSARNAAAKFRFKPRVVDGVPQVTTGVQYIFRYRMDN